MSSVQYSGKKYTSMWQMQVMTMNDYMKQAGIHQSSLGGFLVLYQWNVYFSY